MSATEELRRLLLERGVECYQRRYGVGWTDSNGYLVRAEQWGGALFVQAALTPEDAVDVTVGRETCELVNAGDGKCICFECGYKALDEWWSGFKYCPGCGRRVVG